MMFAGVFWGYIEGFLFWFLGKYCTICMSSWMRSSRPGMRSSRLWMRSSREWIRSSRVWMRSSRVWMRSSRVVRASDSQYRSRNCPGLDPSAFRHSGNWGAADETVLNIVHKKNPLLKKAQVNRKVQVVSDLLIILTIQSQKILHNYCIRDLWPFDFYHAYRLAIYIIWDWGGLA